MDDPAAKRILSLNESQEENFLTRRLSKNDSKRNSLVESPVYLTHQDEMMLHNDQSSDEEGLLSQKPFKPVRRNVSILQIALTTICFFGVQFGWALQISQLTPFIQELGLSKSLSSIVWLCGPIAGLIVQPMVGVLSDVTTWQIGRRRPYIIIGGIFIAFSLALIPNSPDIGHLISPGSSQTITIALAIAGFWILDLSNNTLQGPCRALVVDVCSDEQQELANAIFSVWLGVGNVTGYLAGFVTWSKVFPWVETAQCGVACGSLRVAFTISIILLAVTVFLTSYFTREIPISKRDLPRDSRDNFCFAVWKPIINTIFKMPRPMVRICLVQFFSWFGWFTFEIYITDWVGSDVFHGDSHAAKHSKEYKDYYEGVQWGSFGLAGFALLSIIVSPIIPKLVKVFGPKIIWGGGNLILALLLIATFFAREKYVVLFIICGFGIPWSVTMVVPFALTGLVSPLEERGLYMGVLNIYVVLPQIAVAILCPFILKIAGQVVSSTLLSGGVVTLVSVVLCAFLVSPNNQP